MIPVIHEAMLAVSSSLAASIVAKSTVILALGLIGAWRARGSCAAVRHTLLAAAFGVLLALPVASIVAPPIRIVAPAAAQARTALTLAGKSSIVSAPPAHADVLASPPVPRTLSLPTLLLAAWIAGTALFLLPVAMGLWQVRRLRRSAWSWHGGRAVVDTLALDAGIHRRVEVLLHEALPGPMTCGAVRPCIVLSEDAQTWEAENLNRAIVHELEHVRRGDWAIQCVARAVCAMYWFHPLVWIAWRRLALEAERSCDDAVLGRSEATAYADQLVGLARRLSAKAPLLAMANRADLSARVGAVLDSRQRRGRAGMLPVALACAAAAVLVITMAPLTVVAAQQSPSTEAAGTEVSVKTNARFRASTRLVIEDVAVTDKNGKSIEGLSAKDFTITEDGRQLPISVFQFQKLTAAPEGRQDPFSSYYILGYYTINDSVDGKFRKIAIASQLGSSVVLDYRPSYYADKSFAKFNGARPAVESGIVDRSADPGVTPPQIIRKVEPEYSEEARKAKFQGRVLLSVDIDGSGQVTTVTVIHRVGLGLDEKAAEAVRQWKFKPAMKDGKPVAVQTEVEMDFRLL